jgi:thiamine-monophosphate kinase
MEKPIKELGERSLLQFFKDLTDEGDLPFNDDAVAYSLDKTTTMVVNIDTFVAETDAPPNMTFYQMGSKAVTMAISDLAAKGVQPEFLVASGNFPDILSAAETIQMVKGIRDAAHNYDTKFLGGDTNSANDISLSITVFGRANKKSLLKRSTAMENDVVCTTDVFGLTGAGFKTFLEKLTSTKKQEELFYQAVYLPKARLKEGLILGNYGKITSCIDSSDGLAWCLFELIRDKEKLGIEISNIPVSSDVLDFGKKHSLSVHDLVFFAGEEFELVFTLKEKDIVRLKEKMDFIVIGKITRKQPGKIILSNENGRIIEPKGWEHFKGKA